MLRAEHKGRDLTLRRHKVAGGVWQRGGGKVAGGVAALLAAVVAGCASVPTGGYHGDISKLGTPGPVLTTVDVGEGLLVRTLGLDEGRRVNIQITHQDVPQGQAGFRHVMTIGRFSKVLGSGFARRKNIYYEKRIDFRGKDVFEVDGTRYLVTWACDWKNPVTYAIANMFKVSVQRLTP